MSWFSVPEGNQLGAFASKVTEVTQSNVSEPSTDLLLLRWARWVHGGDGNVEHCDQKDHSTAEAVGSLVSVGFAACAGTWLGATSAAWLRG